MDHAHSNGDGREIQWSGFEFAVRVAAIFAVRVAAIDAASGNLAPILPADRPEARISARFWRRVS